MGAKGLATVIENIRQGADVQYSDSVIPSLSFSAFVPVSEAA